MLRSLYIRDYALIESLEVTFSEGLNIITGETGAGKSILIGALKMILGERANTEVVRTGAQKAVIEGVFEHAGEQNLAGLLDRYQVPEGDVLILRREISAGQSRAFINDSPATASALREIAAELIDLHGQHEHQSLLRVDSHVDMLDAFGQLSAERSAYAATYREVTAAVAERDDLLRRERELREKKELVEFQIGEIDEVGPREGEEEELDAERRVLENAERLHDATAALYALLYDGERTAYDLVTEAAKELASLAEIDATLEGTHQELKTAAISVQEAAQFLQDYGHNIDFNPERLEEIRDRLGRLHYLKMKYGGTIAAVLARREEIGEIYAMAVDFKGLLKEKEAHILEAKRKLSAQADVLTAKRKAASKELEKAIVAELEQLGMPNAAFSVNRRATPDPDGWITVSEDGCKEECVTAHSHGAEEIEFYISANLGEELRPLAMVASGGEISRIMLALKTILARNEHLPILVFDEIDAGISGKTAQQVGRALRALADSHQIIAITHLPQIAARGHNHFLVHKSESDGRTLTRISELDAREREYEIASLLSGEKVSDASLLSARELIRSGDLPE